MVHSDIEDENIAVFGRCHLYVVHSGIGQSLDIGELTGMGNLTGDTVEQKHLAGSIGHQDIGIVETAHRCDGQPVGSGYGLLFMSQRVDAADAVSHGSQNDRPFGFLESRYVVLKVHDTVLLFIDMTYLSDEGLAYRDKAESCGGVKCFLVILIDQGGGYVLEVSQNVDVSGALIYVVPLNETGSDFRMTGHQVSVGKRYNQSHVIRKHLAVAGIVLGYLLKVAVDVESFDSF